MAVSPAIKTISMLKCFRVSSEVIAFVCIGSQLVAVRMLWPSHYRIEADAAPARAAEVGEAAIMRFGPLTSRRVIAGRWDVSPLSRRSESCFGDPPKCLPSFDSSSQATPYARRGEPITCGVERTPQCWNPEPTQGPAVTLTRQATSPPNTVFAGANRLFAGLALHQVRPCDRSAAAPTQRTGSLRKVNPGAVSVPIPDGGAVFKLESEEPLTILQSVSSGPLLAPIVTMLAELAWRRLSCLIGRKSA